MKLISNLDVYWSIAKESHALMQKELDERITPKSDGTTGNIISWDPERRSFKQAMICITFCGVTQDAAIFIKLVDKFGRAEAIKIDNKTREVEKRLALLGINDADLLNRSIEFRSIRKEVVHEKAIDLDDISGEQFKTAQNGANQAITYLDNLLNVLSAT